LQRTLELELIRKCRAGQSRFYEPLVRAYEPTGLRLAVGMMGDPEDAKDALQLAFIKTYKTLPRFDLSRPFGPWFYQILRNQCRDMLRSRKTKFSVEALDERLDQRPADEERGPERTRQKNAAQELLWKGLENIGAEHREVLVLKELEGFRYAEIAQILDVPEGTVASRLYHARSALKAALIELDVEYP
jgi:RNA polymerase sigma-70 factor (ECF subfamily)